MAIKKWEVEFQLLFDTNNVVTLIVKANTERKARIKAEEKVKETYRCNFPIIQSVREIK